MLNKILIIFLLMIATANAGDELDVLTETTTKQGVEVLNDQLRRTSRRIRDIENGVSLTSGVTGILPTANGGTGQNFSTVAQNAIPYFSATGTMGNIGIGTSGYVFTSQGASTPPAWVNPNNGMTWVSNTPVSGAANSVDILITNTNYYKVVVFFHTLNASDTFAIRVNNDTSTNYGYSYIGRSGITLATIATQGTGTTSILMSGTVPDSSNSGTLTGEFIITPQLGVTFLSMSGQTNIIDGTGGAHTISLNFGGTHSDGNAATSFRILTSGGATFSGNVLLYKLTTS